MKLSRALLVAGCLFGMAFTSNNASATVIDFTGNFVDMTPSPLGIDQSGTIYSDGSGYGSAVLSQITGSLPANSMITFSYNFSGTLTSNFLTTSGGYSYSDGGVLYVGNTNATAPADFGFSASYEDSTPVTALALSSAQIDSAHTATVIIKNLSAGILNYVTAFMGTVTGNKHFTVAYNVSAVPVPAALPLFGLGLGALAAMRARSRKKAKSEELAA